MEWRRLADWKHEVLLVHRAELRDALWRDGRPTRPGWVALVVASFLITAWIRDLPLLWDMLVDGGADHRFVRRTDP